MPAPGAWVRALPARLQGRGGPSGPGRWAAAYARLVGRLRWLLIGGWLALAVGAVLVPSPTVGSGGGLGGLVSVDTPAIAAELRSYEAFGFPLLSRVTVVQRDPAGLSVDAQAGAVLRAVAVDQGRGGVPLLLGALPITNTGGVFPGADESGTTVLTSMFMAPTSGFADQRKAAVDYAARYLSDPGDHLVGVTGSIPARAAQAELIETSLPFVEVATVAAIALLVALAFRSPVAAAVALSVAGVTTVITTWAVGSLASLLHLSVPDDVRPLLIALLLGVVTDYCVFFLSGLRNELDAGHDAATAVERATARTAPIVAVAGLTVSVGTGALLIARAPLFRGLGPGLALTVLLALLVTVTLVPAVLAVLGRTALWPSAGAGRPARTTQRVGTALVVALTRRRTAARVVAGTVLVLLLASLPLLHLHLGVSFIDALPADSQVSVAATQARDGFAPGILAPTEVLLEGDGLGARTAQLEKLGALLGEQQRVRSVLGPGYLPTGDRLHVFVTEDGRAARFLVVLDARPLSAPAIDALTGLRERLPGLLDRAGLSGARVSLAGDTALSETIVRSTQRDLVRLSIAALLANLVMLMLFLRALWTSLVLLATSVLALGAALGLTVLLFQDVLGGSGLTFYVPFAAAVLLVSLGSDYNIFAVGRVWDEARERPLVEALRRAVPDSSRAITVAALTLAASFGLLALVPLTPFRELAFAMALRRAARRRGRALPAAAVAADPARPARQLCSAAQRSGGRPRGQGSRSRCARTRSGRHDRSTTVLPGAGAQGRAGQGPGHAHLDVRPTGHPRPGPAGRLQRLLRRQHGRPDRHRGHRRVGRRAADLGRPGPGRRRRAGDVRDPDGHRDAADHRRRLPQHGERRGPRAQRRRGGGARRLGRHDDLRLPGDRGHRDRGRGRDRLLQRVGAAPGRPAADRLRQERHDRRAGARRGGRPAHGDGRRPAGAAAAADHGRRHRDAQGGRRRHH